MAMTIAPANNSGSSYAPDVRQERSSSDFGSGQTDGSMVRDRSSSEVDEYRKQLSRGSRALERAFRKTNSGFESFGRQLAASALNEARKYTRAHRDNSSGARPGEVDLELKTTLHIQSDGTDDTVQIWLDTPNGRIGVTV